MRPTRKPVVYVALATAFSLFGDLSLYALLPTCYGDLGLVNYQRLLSTVEKMTLREDVYAQTQGNIATQVVALYKALGGGWQAHADLPVVRPRTVEQMKSRTDWGDYLEPQTITGGDRDE